MEQIDKVKISKKDFDELYEITPEITGDTEKLTDSSSKQDTTPEFLTQEEEDFDSKLHDDLPQPDEDNK